MTEAARPRILLVTRNLPPLVGGMERLNWHMAKELSRFAQVRVIGPAGSAKLAPAGVEVVEVPLRPLWKFLLLAELRSARIARRFRPEVVLAGSGLMAPTALRAARICGAHSAVYVHGLDIVVPSRLYRALWLPALRKMDRVIANSNATAEMARTMGIARARIGIVHPGVELRVPEADAQRMTEFRATHAVGAGPLLLSVGRLSARKGLRDFVAVVLPRIVAEMPDATLLIVGDVPAHALHRRPQSQAEIRAAAESAGVAERVRFLGKLSESDLSVAYQCADAHVFPIREIPGDPEGFGMVAIEAAAHGLPTIAYATGGVTDAVENSVSGRLVPPGDSDAFAAAVIEIVRKPPDRKGIRDFAARFAWQHFGVQLQTQLNMIT